MDAVHDEIIAAMKVPGNCLKSFERASLGPTEFHGILVSFSEEEVIIRGHPSINSDFSWKGTAEEYFEIWTVD